ncbi:MAG TPA: DUF3810 family protein [Terriglobia bacterium]|nr:DUF3810 family protein [Terriglobia bacterium]
MGLQMVKGKVTIFKKFGDLQTGYLAWFLPALATLTFVLSWAGAFPSGVVEGWFAHALFPKVSYLAGRFADAVSFSWLDLGIPLSLVLLVWLVRGRRFRLLASLVAALYLLFFWTWGLNYHRQPLFSKLPFDAERTKPANMERFTQRVADEINRLYARKQLGGYDEQRIEAEAVLRVERVVATIDGTDWTASSRIKSSRFGNPWFHMAGIEGVFNPFGHEPIVSDTLLDSERPFVIAHELGHVRGYPSESDANLIAVLATVMSDDPALQYSGWLNLWQYLRYPEIDTLLDAGPRQDLQRIFERARRERVRWISNIQTVILDWFLKANSVDEGIRSYSRVVLLAAGTEPYWNRFR